MLLGSTGYVTQKKASTAPPPAMPSEPEVSAEVEEVIGVSEEVATTTETTSEIDASDFEVSEPVDWGLVI